MELKKIRIELVLMNTINIKEIRKSCNMTQEKIAKLIGITQQQYSRYETNTNKIPLEMFLKIVDICGYQLKLEKNKKSTNFV